VAHRDQVWLAGHPSGGVTRHGDAMRCIHEM
jgi:hypothetical protein